MSKKVTNSNLKVSDVAPSMFADEMARKATRGRYKAIVEDVIANKRFIKVEGLTKGQVAALIRVASDANIQYKPNYRDLSVLLGPAPKVK